MLSIIFNCTKLQKLNRKIEFDTLTTQTTTNNANINNNNHSEEEINGQIINYSVDNNSITLSPSNNNLLTRNNYEEPLGLRRSSGQPQPPQLSDDLYKNKNKYIMTTFINNNKKPSSIPKSSSSSSSVTSSKYRYQVSKSYLV